MGLVFSQVQSGGAVNIVGSDTRNVAQGALTAFAVMPTPDQVTGVVLPTNGLIAVWYQATWQESSANTARAAIFLGANQVQVQAFTGTDSGATPIAAATGSASTARNSPLFSTSMGLATANNAFASSSDVSTGQTIGMINTATNLTIADAGGVSGLSNPQGIMGGPCWIFATAGTYTVSVQFRSTAGTVSASNRKLWVKVFDF